MKTNTRKLIVDCLEARQMLSATVHEVEPNNEQDTATRFNLDAADHAAELVGEISNVEDEDFFRFTPGAGSMHLDASSPNGLSVKVAVEDELGNKLFETEPNDGVLSGDFEIAAGRTVNIRVEGKNDTGSYTIRLNHTPDGGGDPGGEPANVFDEVEPNDTDEQPNLIDLGSDDILQIRGMADGPLDRDYFQLTARHAGNLDINILPSVAEGLNLEIKDANGDRITEIETYYGVGRGTVHLEAGETIFLRMRTIDNDPSPYAVDLTLSNEFDPADLNGDGLIDAADAGIMFSNFGRSGAGDINGDGIVDAADAGQMYGRWTG